MKYKIIIALLVAIGFIAIASSQSVPILSQYCNPNQVAAGSSAIVTKYAPWYCQTTDPIITDEWIKYFPIMFIVVTLSYTIAAVLFMFGVALRNDRLRTFGTAELYEATATALMAILFTFIAAVMFGLLPSITVGAINPYDAALSYIATTINTTFTVSSSLFNIAATNGAYAQFAISGSIPGPAGPQEVPNVLPILSFAFYYLFFWPAFSLITFMFEAMLSLYVQFYMIVFFMYAAIPVFLIPGIIFRALIPTRNMGGMMIAMAIGFYFIMPTLFSVAYYFTSTNIQAQLAQTQSALNRYGNGQDSIAQASTPTAPLVISLTQAKGSISSYWLSIIFFPALILTLTYMIITQIAEILGGMGKSSSRLRSLV